VARALATSTLALSILALAGGCEARSSIEAAQTAVSVGQTSLPGLQTALPGLQATAQAGATLVGGVLSDPRAINAQLQALLAGSSVDVQTTPDGAPNESVTSVTVTGTDSQGTFAQLDTRSRQTTSSGALLVLGQYFPKANISLTVVDRGGTPLVIGTKTPGQLPAFQ
jgi:hypothetical protein